MEKKDLQEAIRDGITGALWRVVVWLAFFFVGAWLASLTT